MTRKRKTLGYVGGEIVDVVAWIQHGSEVRQLHRRCEIEDAWRMASRFTCVICCGWAFEEACGKPEPSLDASTHGCMGGNAYKLLRLTIDGREQAL